MKIAKIEHYRCDDYAATTYIWIPDEWTSDDLSDAIHNAKKDYLAFLEEWSKIEEVNNPGWNPDYKKYPNKTVAEIDAEHAAAKAAYEAWDKQRSKAYNNFSWYLRKYGCLPLWDYDDMMKEEVWWSHLHHLHLEYEDTLSTKDNTKKDLPGPLKTKELWE